MTIQLMDIIDYTTSDGPGFRTSVYCAGCNHKCKGCHNPHTWNFNGGKPTDIKEIYYQKSLVGVINQNVNRIGLALMAASLILLIIAITLIRNTIRLSVYSKRFLVRSMQLVGATPAYIRRPFIRSGVLQGFFGALIADALLALLIYGLDQRLPELTLVQDYKIIIGIFVGIIGLGILLGGLSTRLALRKYLHADVDRLYA